MKNVYKLINETYAKSLIGLLFNHFWLKGEFSKVAKQNYKQIFNIQYLNWFEIIERLT